MAFTPLSELLETSPQLCPTPIDVEFYEEVGSRAGSAAIVGDHVLGDFGGLALELPRGAALRITLLGGAQIVNAFAFNLADPDERIWHQSVLREGVFLRRHSRVWGTMARYRPLLTVLEDTLGDHATRSEAQHHPFYGGSGTPADWRAAGGAAGVPSTWEQFAGLLDDRGVPVHILCENLCLFQRSVIDPDAIRIEILRSRAVCGDAITVFAEIDLCVLLALSPYLDGARSADEPGVPQPRPIRATVTEHLAAPLPWPYPGLGYPDLDLYLDASGTRSDEAVSTVGIDYRVHP